MRVKAVITYDGSLYEGFQKQKRTPKTVTGVLEKTLRSLQIDSPVTGSGRTDAGVHATGQVIHFDLPPFWNDLEKLKVMLNRKLTDIRFKHITAVPSTFHARFDAKKRIYRYVFKTVPPSVFEQKYISYYPPFDTVLLQEALKYFVGEHDFSLFHKSGSDIHTSVREIYHTAYIQRGKYHYIYFQANGFLRSQVRMMIDAAMQCANGEMTLTALREQLGCTKKHSTKLAPPQGLYLAKILY
jgi:tRNA pseudouridine38-40 synthase